MGRIVVSEFISLDGVVEDPAGAEGFRLGGWVGEVGGREEVDEVKLDEALGADALLLGRRTYDFFAARWPSRDGALADRLNGLPKYVVSSSIDVGAWGESTVVTGDVVNEVSALRREQSGELLVYGSLRLVRTLLEHDLVDELRLIIYPVVLGAGERLFGATRDQKPMRLAGTRTVGDGIALLTYEPV